MDQNIFSALGSMTAYFGSELESGVRAGTCRFLCAKPLALKGRGSLNTLLNWTRFQHLQSLKSLESRSSSRTSIIRIVQIVQQLISIALTPQSLNCRRSKPPFSCGLVPRISRPCVGPPSFCVPGFPLRRCELFQLKSLLLTLPLFYFLFQSSTRTPKQNADKDYTDSSYH